MVISIFNLVVNVCLNLSLIHIFQVNGLALATSCSAVLTFFVLLKVSRFYIKLDYILMAQKAVKVFFAASIAFGIPKLFLGIQPLHKIVVLAVGTIIGSMLYIALLKLLRITELNDVIRLLLRKIKLKNKR